ncbi:MAG TPA: terpene cyclase/mutase family protein [Pyrinomonadaceae bacterium]|nr:terpene cyclase/mutase family protein [Pyrinomonadaceae bacterium]
MANIRLNRQFMGATRPFQRDVHALLPVSFFRMISTFFSSIRTAFGREELTNAALLEHQADSKGLKAADPGNQLVIKESVAWIGMAQDSSGSRDGGVSRDFSLIKGWNSSYPETTGYIIPTLLKHAERTGDIEAIKRAERMLDWLVSIQFPDGGFQGSVVGAEPVVPVTFNTGQILLGLADGTRVFGNKYREAMRKAAEWLVQTQDPDGCWRLHRSPFTTPSDKTYETHVSWGLYEAARQEPDSPFAEAATRNVRWALRRQNKNGWFRDCCLSEPEHPLTHTLGYALRGIVEAYRFTEEEEFLDAATRSASALLDVQLADGSLPGRLDEEWRATVDWTCLTGNVQIAACWLILYRMSGNTRFRDAAYAANKFARRTVRIDGPDETRGAVKGSFPVSGGYCTYEYPNWAAKFLIDSLVLEEEIRGSE